MSLYEKALADGLVQEPTAAEKLHEDLLAELLATSKCTLPDGFVIEIVWDE